MLIHAKAYYNRATAAFLVCDISKWRAVEEGIIKWKADIDSKVQLSTGQPIPTVLIANKVGLTLLEFSL